MKLSKAINTINVLHDQYQIEKINDKTFCTQNKINALANGEFRHELIVNMVSDDCELMSRLKIIRNKWIERMNNSIDGDMIQVSFVWSLVIDDLIKSILKNEMDDNKQ